MSRTRSWWPDTPGAAETWARVRDALTRARLTIRDIRTAAAIELGGPLAMSTVIKTLHGGCRTGAKGVVVRRVVARHTRRSLAYLFGPADAKRVR